jgi:hypothetical protein
MNINNYLNILEKKHALKIDRESMQVLETETERLLVFDTTCSEGFVDYELSISCDETETVFYSYEVEEV